MELFPTVHTARSSEGPLRFFDQTELNTEQPASFYMGSRHRKTDFFFVSVHKTQCEPPMVPRLSGRWRRWRHRSLNICRFSFTADEDVLCAANIRRFEQLLVKCSVTGTHSTISFMTLVWINWPLIFFPTMRITRRRVSLLSFTDITDFCRAYIVTLSLAMGTIELIH